MPTGGHADGRALQAWAVTLPLSLNVYVPGAAAALVQLEAIGALSATQSPRFIAAAASPDSPIHTLPHVDQHTCQTTQRMPCRVARLTTPVPANVCISEQPQRLAGERQN